eukprot:scpid21366/ scgid15601/ Telomere length regulation protein TEL2 homolog
MTSISSEVRDIGSNLKRCQTASDLADALSRAQHLLDDENQSGKDEFLSRHFSLFCQTYLCSENVLRLLSELDSRTLERGFAKFFLTGPQCESFLALQDAFQKCQSSFGILYIVELLERFLGSERLVKLLSVLDKADADSGDALMDGNSHTSPSLVVDHTIVQLCSLPDIVAKKLGAHHDRSFFFQEKYFTTLGERVLSVLHLVYKQLSKSQSCSLKLVCHLVSKVCLRGHTGNLFGAILPELCCNMQSDFLWRRIGHRLVSGVDDRPLEPVLEYFITTFEPSLVKEGPLQWLLGDSIADRAHICYLLTNKFLYSRYHFSLAAVQNLFSLLHHAKKKTRDSLCQKVFARTLDIWCDNNSVQHTSYEQHRHLTRALLLSVTRLDEKSLDPIKPDCIAKLLDGVQVHLNSPLKQTRQLGMTTAELLTDKLQMSIERLQFEYELSDDCKELQKLVLPMDKQAKHFKYTPEKNIFQESSTLFTVESGSSKESKPSIDPVQSKSSMPARSTNRASKPSAAAAPKVEELDSDDDSDLEAYPMNEADMAEKRQDVGESKPPVFLRDCIAGLLAREKPLRTTTCLASAEVLIRRNPPELQEVCGELIKILLHLDDEYSLDGFVAYRFRSMIAVTVHCPKQVAAYLTGEFYAINYNLRQRMDMLDVLERAAQELSSPSKSLQSSSAARSLVSIAGPGDLPSSAADISSTFASGTSTSRHSGSTMAVAISGMSKSPQGNEDWRATVERRVAQKTRRFAHASGQGPQATASRFSAVAGLFFFPLMAKFDGGLSTLSLLGSDFLVLGRLIFTLGSILHCAAHSPISRSMAGALLEFLWALRRHAEPFMRQSVLFAHCMILCSVDGQFLLEDHPREMADCHSWLADCLSSDPDEECRKLACHAMPMLENILSKG